MLNRGNHLRLLHLRKRPSRRDAMPLGEAGATTGGGGMLGNENRMAAHRRLLSVIGGLRGREPLLDEVAGMGEHRLQPLGFEVVTLP